MHIINISHLTTPQEVFTRVYTKFDIRQHDGDQFPFALFVVKEGRPFCLSDDELWKICEDTEAPERGMLFLKRVFNVGTPSRNEFVPPLPPMMMDPEQVVVSDRPPQEVISSNMELFFPDVKMLPAASRRNSKANSLVLRKVRSFSSRDTLIMSSNQINPKPRSLSAVDVDWSESVVSPSEIPQSPFKTPKMEPLNITIPILHHTDYGSVIEEDDVRPATFITTLSSAESDNQDLGDMNLNSPIPWLQGDIIGKGSFGTVYYGVNCTDGTIMAVKQVELPGMAQTRDGFDRRVMMVEALESEISFLRRLEHENIVRCYGSRMDDFHLTVFLEYVSGGSISSMISKQGRIPGDDAKSYIEQVVAGVAYLHDNEIIHRDIKGANILVSSDHKIKISDFGLAQMVSSARLACDRRVQGSVFWMPPEIIREQPYDERVDIWSIGCLYLEMLTGKHPWSGLDKIQAVFKIGHALDTPLSYWREHLAEIDQPDDISSEALQFIGQCCCVNMNERPSASQLMLGLAIK
jgi:hypothetical protein